MNNLNNYPINAFPSELRDAIIALHEDMQMPIEMIATTLLAASSLALQPLVNIVSPYDDGKIEPCSLYFLTLAKSGEGKSPLRERIMQPFEEFIAKMQGEYTKQLDKYENDMIVWSSKEKALNSSYKKAAKNGGDSEVENLLLREHLETKPIKPTPFEIFYEDSTPEGIIQGLKAYPYAGVFSDEAITFFTGHLKNNLGLLNKIWKNEPISLSRKKEGSIRLNANLTFLLMVQPEIFDEYLKRNSKQAISSGFLARFLFTNTVSTIKNRKITLNQTKSKVALEPIFEKFKLSLCKQEKYFHGDELVKKTLSLSQDAKNLFEKKLNDYQSKIIEKQPWEHISEFVSKAGNNAIRLAAIFQNDSEAFISKENLDNAFTIIEWHLEQASQYFYYLSSNYQLEQNVYQLFEWIKKQFLDPGNAIKQNLNGMWREWTAFPLTIIEQYGPAKLRRKEIFMPLLDELIALGLIATVEYYSNNSVYIAAVEIDTTGTPKIFSLLPTSYTPPKKINIIGDYTNLRIPSIKYDREKLRW
ncbi:YfjI family protein [Providencia stuartii]|uniref:YfjI family protein n=1 Tax=Providencia TaxID=586 RepID=UPI001B585651|nr:YfjI family protein [Providencia stuartii]MBQ0458246.1 DUF3987 domain-containing protein [Providencia stuartii]